MSDVIPFRRARDLPPAPEHLSEAMKAWWDEVVRGYQLESHHLKLLRRAAEAWEIAEAARVVVEEKGSSFKDRFGQPKERPEAKTWKDNADLFRRLLRELRLEAAPEDSRPPALF